MRAILLGILAFVTVGILAPASSSAREIVRFNGYSAGTIIVKTNERRLYYILDDGKAIRYPVGVGKAGMAWSGTAFIDGKYIKPGWMAPASIRRDPTRTPSVIPGGSTGNPMGAAAMTLSGGGEYASMAPTIPARSAASCPMDASACTIRTLWICMSVSASARKSSYCGERARRSGAQPSKAI